MLDKDTIDRLRQVVLEAPDSKVAGRAYDNLFRRAKKEQLRELARDSDTSIALHAYAELHRRLVPRTRSPAEDTESLYGRIIEPPDAGSLPKRVLDPLDTQRFLGFLEGRTGLQLPDWWQKAYREPYTLDIPEYHEVPLGRELRGGYLEVPNGLSLVERNGRILIEKGDSALSLPKAVVKKLDAEEFFWRCTAEMRGDTGVVAFYDVADSYFLFSVQNGRVQWQAEGWGFGSPGFGGITGPWFHDLEVSTQDEHVVVFGSGSGGAYVEAFDSKTGANRFRFSKTYWLQRGTRTGEVETTPHE